MKHIRRKHSGVSESEQSVVSSDTSDSSDSSSDSESETVTADAFHQCELCKKNYRTRALLRDHVRRVHEKSVVCAICGRSTRNIVLHFKRQHDTRVICCLCKLPFASRYERILHNKAVHKRGKKYVCSVCQRKFKHKGWYEFHLLSVHSINVNPPGSASNVHSALPPSPQAGPSHRQSPGHVSPPGPLSPQAGPSRARSPGHVSITSDSPPRTPSPGQVGSGMGSSGGRRPYVTHSAFGEAAENVEMPVESEVDVNQALVQVYEQLVSWAVAQQFDRNRAIVFYLSGEIQMFKMYQSGDGDDSTDSQVTEIKYFRSDTHILMNSVDIEEQMKLAMSELAASRSLCTGEGSSWVEQSLLKLRITWVKYRPLRGGRYIPTPLFIRPQSGLVNPWNDDEYCLLYCIYLYHNNGEHPRAYDEAVLDEVRGILNLNGLTFPIDLKHLKKVEEQNPYTFSVIAVDERGNSVYPLRAPKTEGENHLNLLYLKSVDGEHSHFAFIRCIHRFLSSVKKTKRQLWFCCRCFISFYEEAKLISHAPYCQSKPAQEIRLPKKEFMQFENYHCLLPHGIFFAADFEAILEKVEDDDVGHVVGRHIHKHVPISVSIAAVLANEKRLWRQPFYYQGKDCATVFLRTVLEWSDDYWKSQPKYPPICTADDMAAHDAATECYLCHCAFDDDVVKCLHHLSTKNGDSNFLGSLCRSCNLKVSRRPYVPVYIMNFARYDLSFVIQGLADLDELHEKDIQITATSKVRFNSMTLKRRVRIVDALSFLGASLKSICESMIPENFVICKEFYGDGFMEKYDMCRKTEFPYNFLDSEERLEFPQVPPKEGFFSDLTQTGISDESYEAVKLFWDEQKFNNLGKMLRFYNIHDSVILCDAILTSRNFLLEKTSLCYLHYTTMPSYSWDAWLFISKAQIPYLKDPSMVTYFESMKIGGLSQVLSSYVEWKNPWLNNVGPNTEYYTQAAFLDLNQSYPSAMAGQIATSGFEWMSRGELDEVVDPVWLSQYDPNVSDRAYFLTCHLRYPPELHARDRSFALIPEHVEICYEQLSPVTKHAMEANGGLHRAQKATKLTATFNDRERYTLSLGTLKYYVECGIQVVHVYEGIKCYQSPIFREYILKWNQVRRESLTAFINKLAKGIATFPYGRSLLDPRKYDYYRLVKEPETLIKLSSDPRFAGISIFANNLCAVQLRKRRVTMSSPLAIGAHILCKSKFLLQEFWSHHVQRAFGAENVYVNIVDTDSLCFTLRTPVECQDDIYTLLKKKIGYKIDFSNFPKNHPCFDDSKAGHLGLWKSEFGHLVLKSMAGVCAKNYAVLTQGENENESDGTKIASKGNPKWLHNKLLLFEHYVRAVLEFTPRYIRYNTIRADSNLQMFTSRQRRLAAGFLNDKRFMLQPDPTGEMLCQSLAYGDPNIEQMTVLLENLYF